MSFKIPCGGFKLDEKSFSLDKNDVLSVSGGGVQPDYNQNNETATDYIKNRPFYENELLSVTLPGTPFVLYKVSSDVPTIAEKLELGTKIVLWANKQKKEAEISCVSDNAYSASELGAIVALTDNAQLNVDDVIITLPERGTYFLKVGDITTTGISGRRDSSEPEIEWNGNTVEIKHIDEKFIPEMTNVLLKSSTPDSTKKFKITVDDSGTIKATEVT